MIFSEAKKAEVVKQFMKDQKLSITKMAEALNVTRQSVINYRKGRINEKAIQSIDDVFPNFGKLFEHQHISEHEYNSLIKLINHLPAEAVIEILCEMKDEFSQAEMKALLRLMSRAEPFDQ